MSNHFQHHTDDSTDFFSGDNALFDDSIWNDNQYPGLGPDLQNGGDNASHAQNGQAWAYAPESLGLAGRADDQYAWDNSIDSNHYYSNGVSNNQFSNDHEADRAGNGNAYQPPPSRLRQDIPEPQAQSFNSGLTSNNAFSASPYAFENARPNHQTLQGSAISPHALQLSEPRKAPTSREVSSRPFAHNDNECAYDLLVHPVRPSQCAHQRPSIQAHTEGQSAGEILGYDYRRPE